MCSVHLRDLHSFPTRRSSNLADDMRQLQRSEIGEVAESFAAEQVGSSTMPHKRDRKSTRLNSSHRCISYAVFCLKKKKKDAEEKLRNKHINIPHAHIHVKHEK